jgi:hypothetical protein
VLVPILFQLPPNLDGKAAFTKSIEFLNNHLGKNAFVAGTDAATLADLFILPELDQLEWMPDAFDFNQFPHVQRYVAALKSAIKSYDLHSSPARAIAASLLELQKD